MSLRAYQQPHFERIYKALLKHGAALDASDTGTGKTYTALAVCAALGAVPLVVGTKSSRAGWEKAAADMGVDIEFINWEKLRGRRSAKGIERPVADTEWLEEVPWGKGSFLRWKQALYLVIFDEIHRAGGATSLNSKAVIAAKRQAKYVLGLSATAADDPRQMKALGFMLGLHGLSKKTRVMSNYMGWLLRHGCTPGVFGGFDLTEQRDRLNVAFSKMNAEIFPERGARMRKVEIPGFPETVIDVKLLTPDGDKAAKLATELHNANVFDLALITKTRQGLETLKVEHFVDMTKDYALSSKVVIFLNFTEPLMTCAEKLRKEFGNDRVGVVWGGQTDDERRRTLDGFQANKLDAIVGNCQAAGESANMHDPTGQVERTAIISPPESGRQFKQLVGRVNREGGARSLQLVVYFKGTYEEETAKRLENKGMNIELFNDADLKI